MQPAKGLESTRGRRTGLAKKQEPGQLLRLGCREGDNLVEEAVWSSAHDFLGRGPLSRISVPGREHLVAILVSWAIPYLTRLHPEEDAGTFREGESGSGKPEAGCCAPCPPLLTPISHRSTEETWGTSTLTLMAELSSGWRMSS